MTKVINILIMSLIASAIKAQVGQPWRLTESVDCLTFPAAHNTNDNSANKSLTFANGHETNLTIENSGTLRTFDDGTVLWTIALASEQAENMNVFIKNVDLKIGEYIYIYSPQSSDFQEYSVLNKNSGGYIQSFPIDGDSLIVEYQGYTDNIPDFEITAVNCGFMPLNGSKSAGNKANAGEFGSSQSCEVDASCIEGIEEIAQSSCRIVINGKQLGSGVLVANTAHDTVVYVLSAAHCIPNEGFKSASVQLNWEVPLCNKRVSRYGEAIDDVSMVYYSELRDAVLYRLNRDPLAVTHAYLSGWDLTQNPEGPFLIIHHPNGDVRKTTVSMPDAQTAIETYTLDVTANYNSFDEKNHWRIRRWERGATEGGSSGCGLWTKDNKVIGFLTGGQSTCSSPTNDYFWSLKNNWEHEDDVNHVTLKSFLDPENTGTTSIDGEWLNGETYEQHFGIGPKSQIISQYLSDDRGNVAGHNTLNTTYVVQKFSNKGEHTKIDGVYISPTRIQSSHGQKYTMVIYDDDNGRPGKIIAESDYLLQSALKSNELRHYKFGTPVETNGPFYVGVSLYYGTAAVDTLSLSYSLGGEEDNAFFCVNDEWKKYSDLTGIPDINCNMYFGYRGATTSGTNVNKGIQQGTKNIDFEQINNTLNIIAENIQKVRIFNVRGELCLTANTDNGSKAAINISALPTGVYLVDVQSGKGANNTFKILKHNE